MKAITIINPPHTTLNSNKHYRSTYKHTKFLKASLSINKPATPSTSAFLINDRSHQALCIIYFLNTKISSYIQSMNRNLEFLNDEIFVLLNFLVNVLFYQLLTALAINDFLRIEYIENQYIILLFGKCPN